MVEKKYYLITHPRLPGLRIENHGDRKFEMHEGRCTSFPTVEFGGDPNWEITEENIHKGAESILADIVRNRLDEKEKKASAPPKKRSFWEGFFW